jgi:hypothetical protein
VRWLGKLVEFVESWTCLACGLSAIPSRLRSSLPSFSVRSQRFSLALQAFSFLFWGVQRGIFLFSNGAEILEAHNLLLEDFTAEKPVTAQTFAKETGRCFNEAIA